MSLSDFYTYIGMPYHAVDNNCWAFFRKVQFEQFGRTIPGVLIDPDNLAQVAKTFDAHHHRRAWQQVDEPLHSNGVLMRRAAVPIHVGIWLQDKFSQGILHCNKHNGAVFQDLNGLASSGWQVEGYYAYNG